MNYYLGEIGLTGLASIIFGVEYGVLMGVFLIIGNQHNPHKLREI